MFLIKSLYFIIFVKYFWLEERCLCKTGSKHNNRETITWATKTLAPMLRIVEVFMLFGFIFNLDRVTRWFKDPQFAKWWHRCFSSLFLHQLFIVCYVCIWPSWCFTCVHDVHSEFGIARPEDIFLVVVVVFPFYYFFHTVHESCLFAGFQTPHKSFTLPSIPNFVFIPSLLKIS